MRFPGLLLTIFLLLLAAAFLAGPALWILLSRRRLGFGRRLPIRRGGPGMPILGVKAGLFEARGKRRQILP